MTTIADIKAYTDSIGLVYGTEDKGVFLYSLVKMYKPKTVVEIGTGSGSTMLWLGQGVKENAAGNVHSFDTGHHWNEGTLRRHLADCVGAVPDSYTDYIQNLLVRFELQQHVRFHNTDIAGMFFSEPIDLLFSDFNHGPTNIIHTFANIVPMMSSVSTLIIDSASTLVSSYFLLERLVESVNNTEYVASLHEVVYDYEKMVKFYTKHKLALTHVIENKQRSQNSFAMIQIMPRDVLPYRKDFLR